MTDRLRLRRIGKAAASLSWATVDQVLSALSNLVITLAVARGGGAEGLGRYAVAFAAYIVVLGFAKSLASDPLLSTARQSDDRRVEAAATSLTVIYAVAAAIVVASIGLVLGRLELVVVAATLPLTLLHDILRHQAFRRQAPALAALLDGGWLVGSLLCWPVVTQTESTALAILCWSGGAALGLTLAFPVLRPTFSGPAVAIRWWWSDARDYASPLLLDSVVVALSSQALVVVLATMVGDTALGVYRAGQVYFAPLLLALGALGVLVIPYLSQRPGGATNSVALRLSLFTGILSALACGAVLLAEPLLHSLLFGESIAIPYSLLVPLAVGVVAVGASSGLMVVSKARRRGGDIARSRLTSALVGTALLVIGVAMFGLHGAAWALVIQAYWYMFRLAARVAAAGRAAPAVRHGKERARA